MGQKKIFIAFSGVDGAGKTTQVRLLKSVLYSLGCNNIKEVWLRSPHMLAFLVYSFYRKMGYLYMPLKHKLFKHLWLWLEIMSLIPKMLEVKIITLLSDCIIAERYLFDTIVTILVYFVRDLKFIKSIPIRFLLSYIIKKKDKAIFIYLDISCEEAIKRRLKRLNKDDIHLLNRYLRERTLQLIKVQRILYNTLIHLVQGCKVDTTEKTIKEVFRSLAQMIISVYARRQ